jgi:CBS domain containing-hemolysin-like protein
MAPVVRVIMLALSPLAWPIAYCLDLWLGHHSLRNYTRDEISALMRVQVSGAHARAGERHSCACR